MRVQFTISAPFSNHSSAQFQGVYGNVFLLAEGATASGTQVAGLLPAPPQAMDMGNVSLSNNTATFFMPDYFTDGAAQGMTYTIVQNPYGNAYILDGYLYIVGAARDDVYAVIVQAADMYGRIISSSVSVVEDPPEGLVNPHCASRNF